MRERKKFTIQRSLGIELFGLGKPRAFGKRNFPPGQHRRLHKRKTTQFGEQLPAKQKLLAHYGLGEEELRRFVSKARSLNASNWTESLIGLLERRLDNVVFRLGFAPNIAAARRLVENGHIQVNGRRATVASMVLCPGEVIWLTERANQRKAIHSSPRAALPSFLQFQNPGTPDRGVVLSIPNPRISGALHWTRPRARFSLRKTA
jgi:small subunit ribosomal protein S4